MYSGCPEKLANYGAKHEINVIVIIKKYLFAIIRLFVEFFE
jgi:hypothetical protein